MPYATAWDMTNRFQDRLLAEVTDPDGLETKSDALVAAIEAASAEVDAYLSRFTLPLTSVPPVLKLHVCNMAMYHLLTLRAVGDVEDARKRYEDAKSFLKSVASGSINLGLDAQGQEPAVATEPSGFCDDRRFTADTLRRMWR
jgi:phage gp36-like protein